VWIEWGRFASAPTTNSAANAICAPAIDDMNHAVQPVIEGPLATMGPEPFNAVDLQAFYRSLLGSTRS
jgi:hypothetical protein